MKINSTLRLKAGFRAGLHGLVNPRIKDPHYVLGAQRGGIFYREQWLKHNQDRHWFDTFFFQGEPEIEFFESMSEVSDTDKIFRPKVKWPSGLSRIENSSGFEALDLAYGAAV